LRIISWLKAQGQLIKQEDYAHNYPHCWRTDKPIIYRAMSSWFVDVPKIRDRMVELNQQINWIPEHVKDGRFGKWIEGAREWSISRSRFWGCPIPVWRSDNPENNQLYVFGSIKELENFFDVAVEDLHKPFIDTLTKPDPTNPKYTLRRVDEVFDCWFESGSMPYAQVHYPFENKEWFEANFPADFIVEYEAQTRGWFYNMMVLSVALFDRIPFKNCICHGVVLDGEGRKLSKKLKNYVSPMELFDSYGSDALRWFMLSSTIMRGNELFLDAEGVFIRDAVRLYIKPLWNAYNFFCLYANADGVEAKFDLASENIMDKYILDILKGQVESFKYALDNYDTPSACTAITVFLEELNNWYIRRNRSRFWGDAESVNEEVYADKIAAYNTLYSVLHILCRLVAPLLPQISEVIFAGLVNGGAFAKEKSVHLQNFPTELEERSVDEISIKKMILAQNVCNTAHAIRNDSNIRTRQPLSTLTIYGDFVLDDYYKTFIAEEVNVKNGVIVSQDWETVAKQNIKIVFSLVGKRLPSKMKDIAAAAKAGKWKQITNNSDDSVSVSERIIAAMKKGSGITLTDVYMSKRIFSIEIEGEVLQPHEFELTLQSTLESEGEVVRPLSSQDGLVKLDTNLTEALIAEGVARDVVRLIQQSRKDAGLNVADRIALTIDAPASVLKAITEHQAYVCEQTLTSNLSFGKVTAAHIATHNLGDATIILAFDAVEDSVNQRGVA
jgi:isoleucyl-tRNA synthetase